MNFKARIEELQERMEKLKKELRKQKDKESSLLEEKDRLKQVQLYYLSWYQRRKSAKKLKYQNF